MSTKLPSKFNAKTDDRRLKEYEPIPQDDYIGKVTETKKSATKATAGLPVSQRIHNYNLIWEITQGEHKGAKIFENLNLEHEDDKVRESAEARLLSIQDACGVYGSEDLDDIKGIEV